MKVFLHYEDNENPELHKSLKITLPKKWKSGPTSQVLDQFVESYNGSETLGGANPLDAATLHLAIRRHANDDDDDDDTTLAALCSDAVVLEVIPDRADVYVMHGPSRTLQQVLDEESATKKAAQDELKNTVQCTRFGCTKRFPKGGPYPENCQYHKSPPVFHETAKFWSCCPNKKAYDWDDFQKIPGCETTSHCTDAKQDEGQKLFLGGTDLRAAAAGGGEPLRSIDDFNKAQAAGGADAAPVLDRLATVLKELGIEAELYNQVVDGIQREIVASNPSLSDAQVLELVKGELGDSLKKSLKAIAAEQLRIKLKI